MEKSEAYTWLIDASDALKNARQVEFDDKWGHKLRCVAFPQAMVETFTRVLDKIADEHLKVYERDRDGQQNR